MKYLGRKELLAEQNKNININEIRQTVVSHKNQKPLQDCQRRVTYVFQELGHPDNPAGDKECGDNDLEAPQQQSQHQQQQQQDSLCDILHEKEKIRSLITPNPDHREQELLDNQSKKRVTANNDGRSPFKGAQLRVVSINHKKQKKDPVFEQQDDEEIENGRG